MSRAKSRPTHLAPGRKGAFVLGAAAAAVLVGVLLGLAVTVLSRDPRIARIDEGGAEAVLQEIGEIPKEERTGEDELVRAHALFALKSHKNAVKAYKTAIDMGVHDDRTVDNLFALLDDRTTSGAVQVLAEWPDDTIEQRLLDSLASELFYVRHNALKTLDDRKKATDAHRVQVALIDLKEASVCKTRKRAVELLRDLATGESTLEALKAAADKPKDNFCMTDELKAAIDAVEQRNKAAGAEQAGSGEGAGGEKSG